MAYFEIEPVSSLRPYIECLWIDHYLHIGKELIEKSFPDGTLEFVFNLGDGYERATKGYKYEKVKYPHLIGLKTKSHKIRLNHFTRHIGVRIKQGRKILEYETPLNWFGSMRPGLLRNLITACSFTPSTDPSLPSLPKNISWHFTSPTTT
jgi:Domain of unknown function (DUF6597)